MSTRLGSSGQDRKALGLWSQRQDTHIQQGTSQRIEQRSVMVILQSPEVLQRTGTERAHRLVSHWEEYKCALLGGEDEPSSCTVVQMYV